MALAFLFDPNKQFQSLGGVNEVGGFLRVFLNGTDDRATTYKNFDGTLNEADIELDANGRAVVIVDNTKTYRLEVYNRLGGLMWTVSNFTAQGGSGGGGTPVSVEGTEGEVDVDSYSSGGILHFVVGLAQTIKDTLTSLSSSVTSLMASIGLCELVSNKKDTLTGYEASTTDYPSIKAVVDFVNSAMQNMGGKLITDNGDPFTDSSDLPSTTPYNGVNIDDKDYAYVQNAGSAERWSATVVGSSVAWQQEYAINIPVFTPAQQAAIDSGATPTKINNYELHINNTAIHVTSSEKNTWNAKQNAISDLTEIRSGAAAGATALQPNGNGSNVTSTFTAASSRTNISSGEKLSTIFGKIAKWFTDLKPVAFSGSYNDLSNKPTIPSIPTAYTSSPNMDGTASAGSSGSWSRGDHTHPHDTSKQDSLPYSSGKYGISISGSADSVSKTSLGQVNTLPVSLIVSSNFKAGTFLLKGDAYGGQPYVFGNVTIPNNQWYRFSVSGEGSNYCVITLEPSTGGESSPFNIFKILVDNGSTREDKVMKVVRVPYGTTTSEIGDSETPVYVDESGEIKPCSTSKYYTRWNNTTPQWITIGTDAAVRLWYAKNYCVNYADFDLNNSHPSLCYIVCTLPALTSDEIYDLSIEITIKGNGSSIQAGTAIFLIDSENSGFTILSEYAPDGFGGFLNIPQNRITLPSNGNSVKYKVYVSGHAYRVARLA